MKKTVLITLLCVTALTPLLPQDKPAYRLFSGNGDRALYTDLLVRAQNADIVFFGELHNNPIAHWLELELIKDLYIAGHKMILGAEMMESDNQLSIDEYLAGLITDSRFEEEARLWPNYKTDYRPLLQFARDNKYPFIATNVPRRYASMVFKNGFEALQELPVQARQYIAPLPIPFDSNLKSYREITEKLGGSDPTHIAVHTKGYLAEAQALKDATMAWFIGKNLRKGQTFIHFNGSYHSNYNEGIIWYLKKNHGDLSITTINTVTQGSLDMLEEQYRGTADIIIVVHASMTSSH
ncbi:MAG: iron-regulated protein [Spirochaetae bacterium HGW-Spirochaetae-1]|jgi:uncharacterized iron-regulated protein|nr:MAG: iron-regulated protein [Spirochaetae bacterium HGW-Spirochaetae-1]